MTKTTARMAALAAALMFGFATTAPLTASAATQTQKPAAHKMHHHRMAHKGSAAVKSAQAAADAAQVVARGAGAPLAAAVLQSPGP